MFRSPPSVMHQNASKDKKIRAVPTLQLFFCLPASNFSSSINTAMMVIPSQEAQRVKRSRVTALPLDSFDLLAR